MREASEAADKVIGFDMVSAWEASEAADKDLVIGFDMVSAWRRCPPPLLPKPEREKKQAWRSSAEASLLVILTCPLRAGVQ